MTPLRDQVLVAQHVEHKTTESGIVISGTTADTGSKPAAVIAVGPDVKDILPGQEVAVRWNEGLAVTIEGVETALLPETAVLAIY